MEPERWIKSVHDATRSQDKTSVLEKYECRGIATPVSARFFVRASDDALTFTAGASAAIVMMSAHLQGDTVEMCAGRLGRGAGPFPLPCETHPPEHNSRGAPSQEAPSALPARAANQRWNWSDEEREDKPLTPKREPILLLLHGRSLAACPPVVDSSVGG